MLCALCCLCACALVLVLFWFFRLFCFVFVVILSLLARLPLMTLCNGPKRAHNDSSRCIKIVVHRFHCRPFCAINELYFLTDFFETKKQTNKKCMNKFHHAVCARASYAQDIIERRKLNRQWDKKNYSFRNVIYTKCWTVWKWWRQ